MLLYLLSAGTVLIIGVIVIVYLLWRAVDLSNGSQRRPSEWRRGIGTSASDRFGGTSQRRCFKRIPRNSVQKRQGPRAEDVARFVELGRG